MATSDSGFYLLNSGADDELKVYQRIWTPSTPPKAHMVFLHGFSDRVDHYEAFFNILAGSYPIRIVTWDRRGWGKTFRNKSDRGNTGDMHKQITELNAFLNHTVSEIPDLKATPLFLMGHSMGGQEAAYYMLNTAVIPSDARPHIQGLILESPYIGLDAATKPSAFKVWAGRLASSLLPHLQIPNPIKAEYLTPDLSVQKMYTDDPLCHNLGTLECFRDMLERSAELENLSKQPQQQPDHHHPSTTTLKTQLPCPTLWTHGTADKATDFPTSKALCAALQSCASWNQRDQEGDKVWKEYEGWYHQLHNMPDGKREVYAKDVGEWVLLIVGRGRGGGEGGEGGGD